MTKTKIYKKLNTLNYEPVINILSIVIVVLFILNLFFITSLTSSLKEKLLETKEAARPAVLQLTVIQASNCNGCFDIQQIVDKIKSSNVNITQVETIDFVSAFPIVSELIRKYDIKKLPTVIVKGEIVKSGLNGTLTGAGDALVFTNPNPPYFDLESDSIKGIVAATIINPDNCQNCSDVSPVLKELKSGGVVIKVVNSLSEKEAKEIIEKYDIKTLPSIVLTRDAMEYSIVKDNWRNIGTQESDGNLVLRYILPPYKNLATGKIDGLVSVIYITDSSCKDCYNVSIHKRILEGYDLVIVDEKTFDVSTSEGFDFAQKNNITLVPTFVLSKDAKYYPAFYNVFIRVSKEFNENLIFNAVELMGKYKDLETGNVVEPKQG
ncbi:hypothetical protein HYU23_04490 [Candidatus Woesearchaeota archaeon]|nr:hypothetical protein [Candidatus Woesearchaeota archaeon]